MNATVNATNDPFAGMSMDEVFASFSVKRLFFEIAVGIAYSMLLGLAVNTMMNVMLLMSVPVVVMAVVYIALLAAMIMVAWTTSGYVATTVCDAGEKVVAWFKTKRDDAKSAYAKCDSVGSVWTTFKSRVLTK